MVEYKLETQTTHLRGCDSLTSYGINAFEDDRLLLTVHDISTDKNAVEKLIQKFNTHKLSIYHMEQAIEDYLYNLSVD